MKASTPLGFLILLTCVSVRAQASLPAQYFGYVMSQQSSTLLVLDTSSNEISKQVTHPDMVRPASGRFHPSKQRYYAGGTEKVTIWDTTNFADPVYLKTVIPAPGSTIASARSKVYRGRPLPGLGSSHYLYVASIAAYVGLDAYNDITFVTLPVADAAWLLADGKIDAVLGFPPVSQEFRARKIGHVVVDSRVDRPWSQYFCCMLTANRDFVRRYPIATKRAMRAILKANDICALKPERVAQRLVDWGYATRYEHAVQALREFPYTKWREYDVEDAVRFYALWLHEVRVIKSTPQRIIVQGTDWRFLNELKKELKE